MADRRTFTIKITYFKDTGKLYTSAEHTGEFDACDPDGCCYMLGVKDWVKRLRCEGKLPGLQSGRWDDGYILIDCFEGYPCLILPEGK